MINEKSRKRRNLKRLAMYGFVILTIFAGAGSYLKNHFRESSNPEISSIEVKRGDFVDYVELRGEIAVSSADVIAAPYGVNNLRILKLIPDRTRVSKGDEVAAFDPTSLERQAEQYLTSLRQAEAEVERVLAQQRLQEEQIRTDVMSAEFGLETARLDANTRDVVSVIENEKNLLAVTRAEQRMRALHARLASSRMAAEADMAGAVLKKDKALEDLERVELDRAKLVLKSPVDGVISILPNPQASTNIFGDDPIFKDGDQAWAGAAIAELPDMTTIYAFAPVSESDRGRVDVGQPVLMRVEAVPDRDHLGIVSEISTLADIDTSSVPVRKAFDLKIRMEQPDDRLRPGMTVTVRVEVERIPDVIVIPPETIFEKGGRLVVYVLDGNRYRERLVNLARRGETQIMIASGLEPGERIAAKDPTLKDVSDESSR